MFVIPDRIFHRSGEPVGLVVFGPQDGTGQARGSKSERALLVTQDGLLCVQLWNLDAHAFLREHRAAQQKSWRDVARGKTLIVAP